VCHYPTITRVQTSSIAASRSASGM
jgi:hypothetical protein